MHILYKYYNSLPEDYFLDPTLKLAQPKNLNDPFENNIQRKIIEENSIIRQRLKSFEYFDEPGSMEKTIIRNIYDALNMNGVISLSETQRNLLMWAHYANEHKGLCIGYEPDIITTSTTNLPNELNKLHKINYDTSRFDPLSDYFDNRSAARWINSVLKKMLTTKSDEWIYEKEHRYIHPITDCDYILSAGKMVHNNQSRAIYNSTRPMKIISENNGYIKYKFDNHNYNKANFIKEIQKRNNLSFLKKINPYKIRTIYFGTRFPQENQDRILNYAKSTESNIRHSKIYRMTPCQISFQLIPIELYPTNKWELRNRITSNSSGI
ncbi:DUF2971 domain-containing protein [Aeromonas salmonicida]